MWTGCELEESPPSVQTLDLIASITVDGNPGVEFWVWSTREALSELYEQAMGMPADTDEEIADILGELANQVLGPAVAMMPDITKPSTLSIPHFVTETPSPPVRTLRAGSSVFLIGVAAKVEATLSPAC